MQNLCHPLHPQTCHLISQPSNVYHHLNNCLSVTPSFRVSCSSSPNKLANDEKVGLRLEYKPTWLDNFFLASFRHKLAEEVGWESEKEGYDGMIELANALLMSRSKQQTNQAAVRILKSLFPPFLLPLYRTLITPIGGGKIASLMVARVTAFTCQWLMGPCSVNSINLPDGSSSQSGVSEITHRCLWRDASTWRKANVSEFVSIHASFQHRYSSRKKWEFRCSWNQTLQIIAASSVSEFPFLPGKTTPLLESHAWRFVPVVLLKDKATKLVENHAQDHERSASSCSQLKVRVCKKC